MLNPIQQFKEDFESNSKRKNLTYMPIRDEFLGQDLLKDENGEKLADLINKFERHRKHQIDFFPHEIEKTLVELCSSVLNRSHYINTNLLQSIPRNSNFLTFGSCFAAEIHRYLMGYGLESYTVTLADYINSPRMNAEGLSCNYIPIGSYHWDFLKEPESLLAKKYEAHAYPILDDQNQASELQILAREHVYRSERFADKYGFLSKRIISSDVIIFTVGTAVKKVNNKLEFEDIADTTQFLFDIRKKINDINSDAQVFFTLSPVPLQAISGISESCLTAVEADCISKSISRVALYNFFKDLDSQFSKSTHYFPSFEIVRWLAPYYNNSAWSDSHHIQRDIAKLICRLFVSTFVGR